MGIRGVAMRALVTLVSKAVSTDMVFPQSWLNSWLDFGSGAETDPLVLAHIAAEDLLPGRCPLHTSVPVVEVDWKMFDVQHSNDLCMSPTREFKSPLLHLMRCSRPLIPLLPGWPPGWLPSLSVTSDWWVDPNETKTAATAAAAHLAAAVPADEVFAGSTSDRPLFSPQFCFSSLSSFSLSGSFTCHCFPSFDVHVCPECVCCCLALKV